jgi:general stress protein CsbA
LLLLTLSLSQWVALALPIVLLLASSPRGYRGVIAGFIIGCVIYALIDLICGTLYIEKAGCIVLKNELWQGSNHRRNCYDADSYLGRIDSRLATLREWGLRDQLVPRWKKLEHKSQEATIVDLGFEVRADLFLLSGKAPNALVPLAIHGCGVTCLVLHHHGDDPFKTAYKLGIVNMPPYILAQGKVMASLTVGAVPVGASAPPSRFTAGSNRALNHSPGGMNTRWSTFTETVLMQHDSGVEWRAVLSDNTV